MWFRKSEVAGTELLGRWKIDPTDTAAVEAFGDAALGYDERGNLIYIIREAEKDEVMLMTYRVVGDVLITDQPSHPDLQSTYFEVSGERLSLTFGGQPARFNRVAA